MSIATELALLANTKEALRVSLGLSKDVPFSQYASYIPQNGEEEPTTPDPTPDPDPTPTINTTVIDFQNNQYSKDQLPVNLSDISDFIRLSPATMWVGDTLIMLPENTPRIDNNGLMLEVEMTNLIPNNTLYDAPNAGRTRSEAVLDERIGTVTKLISAVSMNTNYMTNTKIDSAIGVGRLTSHIIVSHPDNVRYLVHREVSLAYNGLGYHYDTTTREVDNIAGKGDPIVTEFDRGPDFYEVFVHGETAVVSFRHVLGFGETRASPTVLEVSAKKDDVIHIAYPMAILTDEKTSSIIITNGSPVTRAADLFKVPVPEGQIILGDWDDSVTYTIEDGEAVFTGHGNIRKVIIADEEYDENIAMYPELITAAQNINHLVNTNLFNSVGDSE